MMWTWFELPLLAPVIEWQDEVTAVNRVDLLTRYLNDYRFFLQKIGTSHDMIDLEPDFWGFARGYGQCEQGPGAGDCCGSDTTAEIRRTLWRVWPAA